MTKTWTPAEIHQLRKGIAPKARKKRFPVAGEIVPVSERVWVAEAAGGMMVMHDVQGIGFLSTMTLEALIKRGEPVPLMPMPEIRE